MAPKQREWRSAVDPKTGRTYYYDAITRETQWRKPLDLATPEERQKIEEKERKQRDFFRSMELNILQAMNRGHLPGGEDVVKPLPNTTTSTTNASARMMMNQHQYSQKKKKLLLFSKKPTLIRTISSMDDDLIAELTKGQDDQEEGTSSSHHHHAGMISPDSTTTSFFDSSFARHQQDQQEKGFLSEKQHPLLETTHMLNCSRDHHDQQHHSTKIITSTSSTAAFATSSGVMRSSYDRMPGFQHNSSEMDHSFNSRIKVSKFLQKPTMMKRNTCGSLYIRDTMADPDKDACIKCLCGVFRAHILQSTREQEYTRPFQPSSFHDYNIFNDDPNDRRSDNHSTHDALIVDVGDSIEMMMRIDCCKKQVPSLEEITYFYRYVFNKAQMENDCIIMSLIYVERLLRETNGGVRPNVKNWRSVLFSCMVLSSKVWDDLSMWNSDFSHACPKGVVFSLKRINQLELAVLTCLKYNVRVSASEYAKYYFLMRSMMIRSGLTDNEILCNSPLDIHAAKKFESPSTSLHFGKAKPCKLKRSKSMDGVERIKDSKSPSRSYPATLEQVVRM